MNRAENQQQTDLLVDLGPLLQQPTQRLHAVARVDDVSVVRSYVTRSVVVVPVSLLALTFAADVIVDVR